MVDWYSKVLFGVRIVYSCGVLAPTIWTSIYQLMLVTAKHIDDYFVQFRYMTFHRVSSGRVMRDAVDEVSKKSM